MCVGVFLGPEKKRSEYMYRLARERSAESSRLPKRFATHNAPRALLFCQQKSEKETVHVGFLRESERKRIRVERGRGKKEAEIRREKAEGKATGLKDHPRG